LSSKQKLWCIDDCRLSRSSGHYECKTMLGPDFCSPTSGMSSKGTQCKGTCKEDDQDETGHYKCYVDTDRTKMEHCGLHASNIPSVVTNALEYSNEGKVCAGRCEDKEGSPMCKVVSWEWNEDEKKADLEMSFEYCGVVDRTWTTIGIIIGCILAAIAIIAIVAVIVMKKRYEQVRTNES